MRPCLLKEKVNVVVDGVKAHVLGVLGDHQLLLLLFGWLGVSILQLETEIYDFDIGLIILALSVLGGVFCLDSHLESV